jgi:hypothetical protein
MEDVRWKREEGRSRVARAGAQSNRHDREWARAFPCPVEIAASRFALLAMTKPCSRNRLVAKLTCGGLARLFVTNFDKNFDSSVATIINFYLCLSQKSIAIPLAF